MINRLVLVVLLTAGFLTAPGLCAQDLIPRRACGDSLLARQADSVRVAYRLQGFEALRESAVTMESGFEMPVVMALQAGSYYRFVFIGDRQSRLYEVRLYDWEERMVIFRQKKWGDVDGNVIVYDYVPPFSEFHMMKPVQLHKKKKELCGYVMLFRRNAGRPAGPETH